MKISVTSDNGECFSYDTNKDSMCLCPGADERAAVVAALEEARGFLMPHNGSEITEQV